MMFQQTIDRNPELLSKISYKKPYAPMLIRNHLFTIIPKETKYIYVMAIGSNSIIGDSIGPFVGTLLTGQYPKHLTVIGTLASPLDATTLETRIEEVHFPNNSFVIAVDSAIGPPSYVQSIVITKQPLQPGKALHHELPTVGHCGILAVMLENQKNIASKLIYSDLNVAYSMARTIALGISLAVRQFYQYPAEQPILG
ncbi:spore protease YyaC [Mesobacillus maritimus]|uniref:DUF1256 domain-containing protein n=1 Tax=Mesobacillus maritimus TaxID=1643336 RepID=UPI00203B95B5|nr:DUF1256 domain-containing protein [Mesobacillus maritimus]MCM3584304.1 spore protease YyaC [Mesobacillus maritimus]MCM3669279.1 spore protease YyaC [Mesobacillus maritimus]